MKAYATFVSRHPRLILALTLLLTIFLGYGITKLETHNNNDSELPKDDPIVMTNDRLKEIFGDKEVVMIGIKSDNIYQASTLKKVMQISEDLKKIEGVLGNEISSLTEINNITGEEWGIEVGALVKELPKTKAEEDSIRIKAENNRLIYKRLVSEDGTFTVVVGNVKENYDQNAVYAQAQELAKKYTGPEQIFLAGGPYRAQEIDIGIQKDVNLLLPLALLLVLIGYFISFRTWYGVILPFSVVVLSIVWLMGLMGHLGFHITVVSSALPMVMIAIASSYGIHVLHRYYEEKCTVEDSQEALRLAMQSISPAILMTGLTSAIGSFSLLIFKVSSIREFGILASLGILGVLILSLTYLPAIIALTKPSSNRWYNSEKIDQYLVRFTRFAIRRQKVILISTLAIIILSIVGLFQIRIGTDFVEYFPENHPIRSTIYEFNKHLGGSRSMEIMIVGKEEGAIKEPTLLKKIDQFQRYAETLDGVGYASSFADIIQRINKEMNNGDPAFDKIPEERDKIAQYLLLYSMSGDPSDFSDLIDYDYQRAKIRVMIKTFEQDDHARLHQQLAAYGDELFGDDASVDFGGDIMFWLAQIRYIVTGKIQNIILAVIFVFLFCIFVFRRIAQGFLAIIPLVVSSVLTFGVMGLLGIRLETSTAIITAIGIGIGVDFAIHFLSRYKQEIKITDDHEQASINTMLSSGKAIIFDVFSNILGFIVFVFSGFGPVQVFGWLISLTMLSVAFGTLVLFPSLFSIFSKAFRD